ncbi:MAG: hypothetical protein WCO24_04845, partial [Actinomycetes bacterium]
AKTAAAASQAASLHPVVKTKGTASGKAAPSAETTDVVASKTGAAAVVLASSGIPVSPTH